MASLPAMKRLLGILAALAIAAAVGLLRRDGELRPSPRSDSAATDASRASATSAAIDEAFERRSRGVLVEAEGTVDAVLRDDREGSRHQRFIVRLDSGRTVLISHNIDLAPRVAGLDEGDEVSFAGEYEWNPKGGVVHWTHHDPDGRHPGGWVRHEGRTYR